MDAVTRDGHVEHLWSPRVDLEKGTVALYRRWKFPESRDWYGNWLPCGEVSIFGFWAGRMFWFKTVEERVEIAVNYLRSRALAEDAKKRRQEELENIGAVSIGRVVR